jgi:hypothetical protein
MADPKNNTPNKPNKKLFEHPDIDVDKIDDAFEEDVKEKKKSLKGI